jgi:hypothetical protein
MSAVCCSAEELIFPGGMPDGALPFSYEVAWGAAMGGGTIANATIGADGTFRFNPTNRSTGRGAGGSVERILGPPGGFRMFSGGNTAGIASMLFGDLSGAMGGRGGPLGDGVMNRLTMRFGLPFREEDGRQQLVTLRGEAHWDPRGERPTTASLLSRMLGIADPGGMPSGLELLEALFFSFSYSFPDAESPVFSSEIMQFNDWH